MVWEFWFYFIVNLLHKVSNLFKHSWSMGTATQPGRYQAIRQTELYFLWEFTFTAVHGTYKKNERNICEGYQVLKQTNIDHSRFLTRFRQTNIMPRSKSYNLLIKPQFCSASQTITRICNFLIIQNLLWKTARFSISLREIDSKTKENWK